MNDIGTSNFGGLENNAGSSKQPWGAVKYVSKMKRKSIID